MALLAVAVTISFQACSSDDDPKPPVVPEYLTVGTDQRPLNWQAPDYWQFELTMSLQVQLGDTLVNFQSERDLMCVTIDNEVRAVTGPESTLGEVYFPLTIAGDGSEGAMTLNYYCDNLHRIYTIPNWGTFNPSMAPSGESDIYRPKFTDYVHK